MKWHERLRSQCAILLCLSLPLLTRARPTCLHGFHFHRRVSFNRLLKSEVGVVLFTVRLGLRFLRLGKTLPVQSATKKFITPKIQNHLGGSRSRSVRRSHDSEVLKSEELNGGMNQETLVPPCLQVSLELVQVSFVGCQVEHLVRSVFSAPQALHVWHVSPWLYRDRTEGAQRAKYPKSNFPKHISQNQPRAGVHVWRSNFCPSCLAEPAQQKHRQQEATANRTANKPYSLNYTSPGGTVSVFYFLIFSVFLLNFHVTLCGDDHTRILWDRLGRLGRLLCFVTVLNLSCIQSPFIFSFFFLSSLFLFSFLSLIFCFITLQHSSI